MKRIYEPRAYGPAPYAGCYWRTTQAPPALTELQGTHQTDVAIIGGGFTGLNAALHLAGDGVSVTLLEAEEIGWGASGRNGGFCCLGGGILDNAQIDRRYGIDARKAWRQAEKAAIHHVEQLIERLALEVDRHSRGETLLAHKPQRLALLDEHARQAADDYGVLPMLLGKTELPEHGLSGPFHGALTIPLGFALNPMKYVVGLARACLSASALIYTRSPVIRIEQGQHFTLHTPKGRITARHVIIATNGYSSEDIPSWLSARFMPVQSSVLVTRPLSEAEIAAAGWQSKQMAFDSRNLLHYFRLMPDRRFLFGMRGGIFATRRSDARIKAQIRKDFEDMFPAWAHVETPHHWSGLVSLNAKGAPFVGPVPGVPNLFVGQSYHGNGVAMASYSGTLLADLVQDKPTRLPHPDLMKDPPKRIPLGSKRRWLLPPLYTWMALSDR